ncbi:nitronate monooxygenase family protein [Leptolyngbya sp. CCNP1308]|uniref:NAD(P)H-dependent flavin oxidoreductase n=1 Tax=Leptolyngbya sp. CCNP1308 TaxID=3110255 RepID=UPI002B1FCAF8|nr:nitronate monooxygenase family protein [Leptolyngbya sp. CCNP1308]MEA5448057.1 nitronate monooxygenase family protein [Leptolyngbya sp. CCNP1308]
MNTLPSLRIGSHTAPYPIIQGGMGIRVSGAGLAAAVANAGGIGVVSAVGLGMHSPYFDIEEKNPKIRQTRFFEANRLALIDELQKARALSPAGILGVNIMVAARDYETLVQTAIENGVNLIFSGAGLPLTLPALTANHPEVALVPIISSLRAAQVICKKWQRQHNRLPDAFVVENPQAAGGHLGAKAEDLGDPAIGPEAVIPALVSYLAESFEQPIPVIAAGGVCDRPSLLHALSLGASGVQIGTRFIPTEECDADRRYKEFHLKADPADIVLVPSPVGLPGRALRNAFVDRVNRGEIPGAKDQCFANCLQVCKFRDRRETYCILRALDRACRGDVENGLVFAGNSVGGSSHIQPVAEVMAELVGVTG